MSIEKTEEFFFWKKICESIKNKAQLFESYWKKVQIIESFSKKVQFFEYVLKKNPIHWDLWKKRVQFLESYWKNKGWILKDITKRVHSSSNVQKSSVLRAFQKNSIFCHYKKMVQFFESCFFFEKTKRLNSLSHNFCLKNSILRVVLKIGSILWVVFLLKSILWVVFFFNSILWVISTKC